MLTAASFPRTNVERPSFIIIIIITSYAWVWWFSRMQRLQAAPEQKEQFVPSRCRHTPVVENTK